MGASFFNKMKKILLIVLDTNEVKMVENMDVNSTVLPVNNCLHLFLNMYYSSEDSFYTSSFILFMEYKGLVLFQFSAEMGIKQCMFFL